ncbi:DMT family transporter [Thalassobaculum sp.]|uniref:DMT family transporter n=1 Tax=Thalassobaculum sp. TaxID=2022740 RepID=UPI003B5B81F0
MSTARPPLAVMTAAFTGVQVGAAIVASRAAVDDLGPTVLALFRYTIGAAMILPLAVHLGWRRIPLRDLWVVAALGIGQFGILVALLNLAVLHISAGLGSLIFATMPVQTVLISALLGRQALTLRRLIGAALTTLGVAAALGDRLIGEAVGIDLWIGIGAALASALTGAVCSVLYRPYLTRYPTVQVSGLAMGASVLFLALLAPLDAPPIGWDALADAPWGIVAFIGASSGIGYITWLYSLREMAATEVTLFLALAPITASALGALLLGETLGLGLFVGLGLVIVGMRLALSQASSSP